MFGAHMSLSLGNTLLCRTDSKTSSAHITAIGAIY